MIYNILLLIGANVLIPLIPIPPQTFLAYNVYDFNSLEPSVFQDLNMSRVYTQEDFKKSFRNSMKKIHPDRGGTQEAFDRVKNMKKIMEGPVNYYDILNVTQIDMSYNQPMREVVMVKEHAYYFEAAIFYIIALLYILAFTIDENMKPSRYILLPLTILFAYYEYYIHFNPTQTTVIDCLISDQIPLFVQKDLLKRLFCIISAIVRVYYLRFPSKEKRLFEKLQKGRHSQQQCLQVLTGIHDIYVAKYEKDKKDAVSWTTKLRNWLSKGLSLLFFGVMIWNVISPGQEGSSSELEL